MQQEQMFQLIHTKSAVEEIMMMRKLGLVMLLLVLLTACNSKTKEGLFAEGTKQMQAGNPGGAVVLFKNALEKDENFLDARIQLAKAYTQMGKREQAEKEFMKALRLNPSRDDILLDLAEINNANKKPEEAFKLGEQYLAKHPNSVEGLEVLGVSSAVSKKYDDAERYLQKALSVAPTRAKTKLELAAVYASSAKDPQAKSMLEEVIQSDVKNYRAMYMLAALESKLGNADKALAIYSKITASSASETLAAYKSGLIHIEKGALDPAEKIADDLVKAFPKKADGHRLKGLVQFHRKNYAEAMTNLQASIKIMPTLEGYHFLGLCYYNKGELESALSQFRKILDNVPTSRQARLMTATILLSQKRIDDAINEVQKVLQQDDGDAIAHNLLGNAYMAKGMFEDGMREFNRATKINPKIVDAYLKSR